MNQCTTENLLFDDLMDQPPLSSEEFSTLLKKWREHEDYDARNSICLSYMKIVIRLSHYYANINQKIRAEEFLLPGLEGLHQAIEKFDLERKKAFATYASWWVRSLMVQYIQKHSRLVRLPVNAQVKRTRDKVPTTALVQGFSINQPIRGTEDMYFDIPDDGIPDLHDLMVLDEFSGKIQGCLASLGRRHELVITKRFFEGNTLQDVADILGVSRERVRQIQLCALQEMKKYFLQEGFLPLDAH